MERNTRSSKARSQQQTKINHQELHAEVPTSQDSYHSLPGLPFRSALDLASAQQGGVPTSASLGLSSFTHCSSPGLLDAALQGAPYPRRPQRSTAGAYLCDPWPVQLRLLLLLPSLLGTVLKAVQGCHAINLLPFQQQMHLVQPVQMGVL